MWSLSSEFEANPPAAVLFSITWTEGQGAGGCLQKTIGIPNCNTQVSQSASAFASDQQTSSYWTATTSGQVNGFSANNGFGQANLYGDMANLRLNAPIVGMAALPGSQGHWLLGADGGVFSFGLARFYGSTGGMRLNAPVVGIAVTPDGGGYWLVAKDGGVFGYGDAGFYGSMGGCHSISRSSAWRSIKRRAAIGWLLPMEGSFRSTLRSMAAQGVLF